MERAIGARDRDDSTLGRGSDSPAVFLLRKRCALARAGAPESRGATYHAASEPARGAER
jgi:hypothetical protein